MTQTSHPRCPHIPSCELFPRFGLQSSLKVWKTYYCEGRYEPCARYVRALEGKPVPITLLPNGKELQLGSPGGER